MPRIKKSISRPEAARDRVSDEVGDYSRLPFVIEKNKQVKAFMEKAGFPKDWKK